AETFQGREFLAAHCRRTDFLYARKDTTPGLEAIASQLDAALARTGLNQVFIATDAPDQLREGLRQHVKLGTVHFFQESSKGPGAAVGELWHEGQLAAVEMWVAARSSHFIGTKESRFSMHIQLERSWLGKPAATSLQEFCKEDPGDAFCSAPLSRPSQRKGSHHSEYWEL
ncbi:unnamed protein product, partial [Polarella glacialis]